MRVWLVDGILVGETFTPGWHVFQKLLFIASFLALVAYAPLATAQESTLILLTEVAVADDGSTTESFWWASSSAPEWTATDAAVRAQGATFEPKGLERVSRIYRRPNLTDANAAALAELFGADNALVGEVRREKLNVAPVGEAAIRVSIRARLVEPSADGASVRQEYDVQRMATGDEVTAADAATLDAASTLAGLVSATLARKVGPVGVALKETPIIFEGVPDLAIWRTLHDRLAARQGVDDVAVSWLAEGIIAVALNAKTSESKDTVKRIATELQNEVYEGFELVAAPAKTDSVVLRVRKLSP